MSRKDAETHDWRVSPDGQMLWCVRCHKLTGARYVANKHVRCLWPDQIIQQRATWGPYQLPWLKGTNYEA